MTCWPALFFPGLADLAPAQNSGEQSVPVSRIKAVCVEKVGALTGPGSPSGQKIADVCSTDLGTMTEVGKRIYFAFGDTFGYSDDKPTPKSGVNWRSNVFASTATSAVSDIPSAGVPRLVWRTGVDGRATPIIEGDHLRAFTGLNGEQTKIPTAMVSIGNRIYLHYMSVHGFASRGGVWECNGSKFIYSDDFGQSWIPIKIPFGDRDSNFNMLALTNQLGSGNDDGAYVYALERPAGGSAPPGSPGL